MKQFYRLDSHLYCDACRKTYNWLMFAQLLATKLYVPAPRLNSIGRPRLINQLTSGLHGRLTLISAPAGFGKTTLVSTWIQTTDRPVAWLSLSQEDSDPVRLISYVIAALQTILPDIGAQFTHTLEAPQPPPLKTILTWLLNDLVAQPDPFLLILDDYHVIESPAIHEGLTFLLDHLPPHMHLIITTREDPPLPLARLRVRGQMTELRAADLRFTEEEAAVFLNQAMGLDLPSHEIAALEQRTEGWIAGLQMAALAMQGRSDTTNFIEAFTGSHRFVLDYLIEEVLHNQPPEIYHFLLQTAILGRLNSALCNAVTAKEDSQTILETLERANLFVIALDSQRQWYRYHHLFADVLRTRLLNTPTYSAAALHQRASTWYEQQRLFADAIHHAFAAQDFEQAARLIEIIWPAFYNGFRPDTWLGWAKALPAELVRNRPVLSNGCAWTLIDTGDLAEVETYLRDAEQGLNAPPDEIVVFNEATFQILPPTIAGARAYLAQTQGNAPTTIEQAQLALDLFPEDEHYQRGGAALFQGMAYWASGQLDAAVASIRYSVTEMRKGDNLYFQVLDTVALANIHIVYGQLQQAASLYKQALHLATEQGGAGFQVMADLYIGLSGLYHEWGELQTAADYLQKGEEEAAGQTLLPGSRSRWYVAMAHLKAAEGDYNTALELLDQAERAYKQDPWPKLRPIATWRTQVWLAQGQLTQAQQWARQQGLSVTDDLSYQHEFDYLTLVRILLVQHQTNGRQQPLEEAHTLLARLLSAAEAENRTNSVIEILILQALAHALQNNTSTALLPLKQALALAEPEGYQRIFLAEGEPMQALLSECLSQGASPTYITRLLTTQNGTLGDDTTHADPNQLLVEPLSNRELEVLRLLADGRSNKAIANELVIALSTVKKHVNNILGKLNVSSRTQAANRARKLNIL